VTWTTWLIVVIPLWLVAGAIAFQYGRIRVRRLRRQRPAPARGTVTLTGTAAANVQIGTRIGLDGKTFRIDRVTHEWDRQAFTCEVGVVEVGPPTLLERLGARWRRLWRRRST
jgi:hypothetical protein